MARRAGMCQLAPGCPDRCQVPVTIGARGQAPERTAALAEWTTRAGHDVPAGGYGAEPRRDVCGDWTSRDGGPTTSPSGTLQHPELAVPGRFSTVRRAAQLVVRFADEGWPHMRAVTFTGKGGNEVVRFEERPDPVPASHEVVVAARYAGLNWADVAQRQGNYPPPPGSPADIPGLEVAGLVAATGPGVTGWQVGDRVFGLVGGGGLADRVAVHERHLAAVPANLSDQAAAAVPEAYITAHDAIFTRAGLLPGEVLLVNGANGAVGSAAVLLGLAAGARAVASVRSPGSARWLEGQGALIVSPETARAGLAELGGADVVLELVGAPNLDLDFEVLAARGRIVVVGSPAGHRAGISLGRLMGKRASLYGTVLRARPMEEKAAAVQAFARSVLPLLAAGRAAPAIDRVFEAADVAAGFDYLVQPGKSGKVLLEFS